MYISKQDIRYYETDQMAVVHHSNYIRYCETARIGFLDSIGLNFAEFERSGYVSPVLSFTLNFKAPAVFGDTIEIQTEIKTLKGIRIWFSYIIKNQVGKLLCDGESCHTFCDKTLKPVMLQRVCPEIYEKLEKASKS